MANVEITESGMTFVIEADSLYHIEKSALVAKMPQCTKTPEFITYNHAKRRLVMVEAKQTAPKTVNADDFDRWMQDIVAKFSTAMHLFHALGLRRHPEEFRKELGADFSKMRLTDIEYIILLVVKNHKQEWMPDLMNSVKKSINPLIKWWHIPDTNVKVINEDTARQWSLIL